MAAFEPALEPCYEGLAAYHKRASRVLAHAVHISNLDTGGEFTDHLASY